MKQILFLLVFSTALFSEKQQHPWFTGPLLAPAGHTVPAGKTNYQPYIFVTNNYQPDSSWAVNPFIQFTRGISSWADIKFVTQAFLVTKNNQVATNIADSVVILGLQAMEDQPSGWEPDLRFTLGLGFPTGKFERLNPNKLGTDSTGTGSYEPEVSFNFQKLFSMPHGQWLRPRLFLRYTIAAPVKVHEFNAYGGGFETDGKVVPGNNFTATLAFEYAMTQNWVWALDIQAIYAGKTTFSGKRGFVSENSLEPAKIGNGNVVQWSYAPALEYNFSSKVGVIGGVWFTGATRNSREFISYVLSVNLVM
ncbi:MAG: hypothetical protein ChlgKO_09320 [Chlamydiales bacterium]